MADEPKRERLPQVEARLQEQRHALGADDAGKIAHDVNNPLAVARANIDFLKETFVRLRQESPADDEPWRNWLAPLLEDADVCLADLRSALEEIGEVVRPLGHDGDEATTPLRSALRPKALDPSFRPGRILVVDDQESVTRVIRRILRGHDVVTLESPRLALERITAGDRFDVIFCDVMMPELNGGALYAEIARVAPEQTKRMIFVTGGATTDATRRFLASVPQPVLPKPFDPKQLRALAQQFIAGSGPDSSE
jgi:CheY-like chemotaxis protein